MRTTLILAPILALTLAACEHGAQVTSGAEYLARSGPAKPIPQPVVQRRVTGDGEVVEETYATISTDELIRHAAAIEPILQLPARIGLARIENGELSTVPMGEAELWRALGQRHAHLGSFVAIDPFVAAFTVDAILPQDHRFQRRDARGLVTRIRLGAARQHVDAVLIYEVGKRPDERDDLLGLAPVRVLGAAPQPARRIEKEGVARAVLMDVRNGYPYGIASASADLATLDRPFWSDEADDADAAAAGTAITANLLTEVEAMLGDLGRAMQTKLASR